MSLYREDDHQRLTTDPTIYTASSDSHLLGFFALSDGHHSYVLSQRHHCCSSFPRPSDTFPCHGNAAAPGANDTPKRYWNTTDDGDAYFHAAANEKATFGVEQHPTVARLVQG